MASTLRHRTRLAVQAELADVAQDLFVEHGFAATTVEAIAQRAGISRRSFFRYFASKEDLIASKYGLWVDDMTAALEARPEDEPPWTALRRTFDTIVEYYGDPGRVTRVLALQAVVDDTPSLHAAVLAVFDTLQDRLAAILVDRDAGLDPALVRACVTSAWGAVQAALATSLPDDPGGLGRALDETMEAVRPRVLAG